MLPVRGLAPLLAATEYFAFEVPVPFAPDVIVIQLSLLTVVQAHPDGAVILTAAVPPPAPNELLVGLMEDTQEVGAAS
jgi:hypothetical protein